MQGAFAAGAAKGRAADRFHAVEIQRDGDDQRRRFRGGADHGHEVVFQPAADAEEGEVVAMLHAEAQIAEVPQHALGVLGLVQMPAELQQVIHLIAPHAAARGEELVDHFQGATPAAFRRGAFR